MNLTDLKKITSKKKRRLGQGHGSGRVKTAGRGTKGQKARTKIKLSFEGGALPLIKRLPFRRGKGKNNTFKRKPITVNVKVLNLLPVGSSVNIKTLIANRIVEEKEANKFGVKILGDGEITKALTVTLPISKGARSKIEQAGGKVDLAS